MATVNYYVNPTTGNDSWDGLTPTHEVGPPEHGLAPITLAAATNQPREKYSAIHAEGMSLVKVVDPTPDPFVVNQAAVKILNPGLFKNDEYFGVSLESGSMLIGAQAISFAMPVNNQWIVTVPRRNQFVIDESNTSSIVR